VNIDLAIEFWHWFALCGIALLFEMLIPGIFFMFVAAGAATVGVVLLIAPDLPLTWQLLIFISVAIVTAYVGRKYLVRFQHHRHATDVETLNKRGTEFIGQAIVLVEPIVAGRGRARVGDGTWTVTGPDAPAGTLVEVIASNGNELRVKPRVG
jgi:membrane protein implicated in regulation of membrane protease activity